MNRTPGPKPGTRGSWAPPNHVMIVELRLLLCRPCLFTELGSMGGGMTCAFTLTRRFAPFACSSFMLGTALSTILRTVPRLAWPTCFRAGGPVISWEVANGLDDEERAGEGRNRSVGWGRAKALAPCCRLAGPLLPVVFGDGQEASGRHLLGSRHRWHL